MIITNSVSVGNKNDHNENTFLKGKLKNGKTTTATIQQLVNFTLSLPVIIMTMTMTMTMK